MTCAVVGKYGQYAWAAWVSGAFVRWVANEADMLISYKPVAIKCTAVVCQDEISIQRRGTYLPHIAGRYSTIAQVTEVSSTDLTNVVYAQFNANTYLGDHSNDIPLYMLSALYR